MPVPWLRVLDGVLGLTDMAVRRRRASQGAGDERLSTAGGSLETRLAGVVVSALKEAFNRDSERLELERERMEAERQRAERALQMELRRQAGEREIGRQRLIAAVTAACWFATLFLFARLSSDAQAARVALGIGWLLLLGALAASFAAQSHIGRVLSRLNDARPPEVSAGAAGAAAPWLFVCGLTVISAALLLA